MAGAINWTMVGAIGQIISAFTIINISWMTYRFTTTNTRINTMKSLNDSFIAFNAFVCANDKNVAAATELRTAVTGSQQKDFMVFQYLTITQSYFEYHDTRLITTEEFDSIVKGTLKFVSSLSTEELTAILDEGYSTKFINFLMAALRDARRPVPQSLQNSCRPCDNTGSGSVDRCTNPPDVLSEFSEPGISVEDLPNALTLDTTSRN